MTNKQQYLDLLEDSLMTILIAFADDSKLGITCLQMMTLPDVEKDNDDIDKLYDSVIRNTRSQPDLGQKVIKALKFIRESALRDPDTKEEINKQIKLMIEQTAVMDYCRQNNLKQ